MRTIQPNYFIGILLPWTLEDETNWRKTHRLGGYTWVAGGLLLILFFPFFETQVYSIIYTIIIFCMVFIPSLYSFYIYKTKT